jgi:hypothetical protein
MPGWRTQPDERARLHSPIGLRLIDEITGRAPVGWVRTLLDASDGAGGWRDTDLQAVISPAGVVTYPALERRAEVLGQPARKYRVRIEAQFYVPLFRATQDAVEFDAFPYNHVTPPQNLSQIAATQPQDVVLTPAPHYRFPSHIRLLRGEVVDGAGVPVPDVLVTEGTRERVLTDSRGTFALPLRWVASGATPVIDATDQRNGRTGTITINFPQDLRTSQTITIA